MKDIAMRHHPLHKAAALAVLFAAGSGQLTCAQTAPAPVTFTNSTGKEVLIPPRITRVPDGNDFNNPDSEYSFKHSKATDNFVLFWAKDYGDDPMTNAITNRRFDVDAVLKESDRFYDYYVNTLKWVDKDKSFASKYKFLFFVIPSPNTGTGTAFGGTINDKIGAFWTPATRITRGPYGVVAHELGHSFQALIRADGAATASFSGGSIHEMTSQWMLWQVYPDWMTFENYHLVAFMNATHLAFQHEDNQYHSAQVLEYWSEKHGVEIIGKMWREVQRGEDPVMTYKRLTGVTQEQFNDEMFDAARHFVTWDMPRIEKVAALYANQHTTSITAISDGWYQIAVTNCPQNYGYNAIQLKVPAAGTQVSLDFKGVVGAEGFHVVQPEKAGWRYGFLASREDGSRVYGDALSKSPGTAEFTVPANTKFLWLVVSGAPTEHWIHVGARGGGRGRGRGGATTNTNAPANAIAAAAAGSNANEQWPYQFKLTGTTPVDSIIH
jgi:hypothetical protein